MTQITPRRCIRIAAADLDRMRPGWHNRIDTDTLDLASLTSCVMGQVFAAESARFQMAGGYEFARVHLRWKPLRRGQFHYAVGGAVGSKHAEKRDAMRSEWIQEILSRRENDVVNAAENVVHDAGMAQEVVR